MTKYRPEIDGLRAVAVLSVVFFHARVAGFSGGFVGVDVFFVISGYLISLILLSEMKVGRFGFVTFWERRVRRILPALVPVVLFTAIVGWWVLLPKDFDNLGRSIMAQSAFSSNVLFWKQQGYFGPTAEERPLLHTWSLAVEEQFYMLFPLFFFLLFKYARRYQWQIIMVLAVCSLALAERGARGSSPGSFYLLPTRAWELAAGSLVALWSISDSRVMLSGMVRECLSVAGLGAILIPIFLYDSHTWFPGIGALPPVVGSALVILSNLRQQTVVGRALAVKPLVAIGLVSYSLYLWHWPLLVFAQYESGGFALSSRATILVLIMSLLLAIISWRFVETPVRAKKSLFSRNRVLIGGLATQVVLAGLGFYVYSRHGFPERMPPLALKYAEAGAPEPSQGACIHWVDEPFLLKPCKLGSESHAPALIVWGDSHATALLPLLGSMADGNSIWVASAGACPPLLGIETVKEGRCGDFNQAVINLIAEQRPRHVLLVARWGLYTMGHQRDGVEWQEDEVLLRPPGDLHTSSATAETLLDESLRATVARLRGLEIDVWILRAIPEQLVNVPRALAIATMRNLDTRRIAVSLPAYLARQASADALLQGVLAQHVHLLDATTILCKEALCRGERNGQSLYRDDDHLSKFGSFLIRPVFGPLEEQLGSLRVDPNN